MTEIQSNIHYDIALAKWAREVALPALEELKIGHIHSARQNHIRQLGVGYGWCNYCSTRVSYGPCVAGEALESMPKPEKENAEHEDY